MGLTAKIQVKPVFVTEGFGSGRFVRNSFFLTNVEGNKERKFRFAGFRSPRRIVAQNTKVDEQFPFPRYIELTTSLRNMDWLLSRIYIQ